ncbi:MAG: periplasmic heavy metal sensor [Rhizobiales bacterium]|nr:periplasmic heavy metal sensor [Hyphomicrobiales bacterium]
MSDLTASEIPPVQAGRARLWWIVLIVSLALNLAAIGVVVAHLIIGPPPPPDRIEGYSSLQILPRAFVSELKGERRDLVIGILRKFRGEFRARRAEMRANTEKIAAALEAEPYDPESVEHAIDQFSATGRLMIDGGVLTVKSVIEVLTPDERKLLAKRIRERDERRRRPRREQSGVTDAD